MIHLEQYRMRKVVQDNYNPDRKGEWLQFGIALSTLSTITKFSSPNSSSQTVRISPPRASNLQQIRQFVLDELDRLEEIGLGAGAGNHHLAAAKYQADDLGVVESVD